MKKIKNKVLLIFVSVAIFAAFGTSRGAGAAEPVAGAVNNWFDTNNATTLSVDMTPNKGEDGYHFYSLSPFFQGQSYGLYSGIQTNGNLGDGGEVGNIFIFSVWNATQAFPENGATPTPFSGEGVGYSLRKVYDWSVGTTYTITINRESFDAGNNGWRWSATITNKSTSASLKLGEILAPLAGSELTDGSAFHERYAGTTPSCNPSSSNLEEASVTFSNLSANTGASFAGWSSPNNIFSSVACANFIHVHNTSTAAVTGFGISQSVFDAIVSPSPPPAPDPRPDAVDPGPSITDAPVDEHPEEGSDPTETEEKQEDTDSDNSEAPNSEIDTDTKYEELHKNEVGGSKTSVLSTKNTLIAVGSVWAITGSLVLTYTLKIRR